MSNPSPLRVENRVVARPRRGRPPVQPEQARSRRIVTFVTQSEWKALKEISDRYGRSMSAVCYDLLLAGLRASRTDRVASPKTGEPK